MNNVIIERFENLSHLVNELSVRQNNSIMKNDNYSQTIKNYEDCWEGTKTYQEALDYLHNGYDKPLSSIKRGLIKTESKTSAPRRSRPVNDVIGYSVNVPLAIMGIPQNMIRSDTETKKSKIIDLIYSPDANAGTSSEDIERAGIAVLSLINDLEKNGYRVALSIAFFIGKKHDEITIATVKVKDWRQPIDLKKIAFPVCNAGMLRRIGFKWLETCDGLTDYGWSNSYGSALEYEEAKKLLKEQSTLSESQYFINIPLCENHNFDKDKIARACGMII